MENQIGYMRQEMYEEFCTIFQENSDVEFEEMQQLFPIAWKSLMQYTADNPEQSPSESVVLTKTPSGMPIVCARRTACIYLLLWEYLEKPLNTLENFN